MNGNFFILENSIFNYDLDVYEFKIYAYLCMRADIKTKNCFPFTKCLFTGWKIWVLSLIKLHIEVLLTGWDDTHIVTELIILIRKMASRMLSFFSKKPKNNEHAADLRSAACSFIASTTNRSKVLK